MENLSKDSKSSWKRNQDPNLISTPTPYQTKNAKNNSNLKIYENNTETFDDNNLQTQTLYTNEKRKNMECRHKITQLKSKIIKLQQELQHRNTILSKLQYDSERDKEYLSTLEKMVTKYKQEDKITICQKQHTTEDTTNPLSTSTITTKRRVSIATIKQTKQDLDKQILQLTDDIKELTQFKQDIMNLTNNINRNNEEMLTPFKQITEILCNLNIIYKQKEDNLPLKKQTFYEDKQNVFIALKNAYDDIIKIIEGSVQLKQDEFNYLLNVKTEETEKLLMKINALKEERNRLLKEGEDKTKMINDIRNENEYIKNRDWMKLDEATKENQTRRIQLTEMENQKIVKGKTKEIHESISNSVKKIRKNFDMTDQNNIDLINIINTQIQV